MNTEKLVVSKFGGSSMANADALRQVADIIRANADSRIIVVSAPGKEKGVNNSKKITDLLITCGHKSFIGLSYKDTFGEIEERFLSMAEDLEICIDDELDQMKSGLSVTRESEDFSVAWAASRGEWLSACILSKYLGAEFVEAADIMRFDDTFFNQKLSYGLINERLKESARFIIPGFYGQDAEYRIRIFPRGGSDITGAYLAGAVNAYIYENWTDTNGVLTADPNIVPNARTIANLSYEEMAELGISGAQVFHYLALGPVWEKRIPVNVRNTFNPSHPGTIIS